MMPALSAHQIYKTFQEGRETVEVLRGASLSLWPGEVTALEGPSGSGKSTLLCIIGCVLTPTAGSLAIDGMPVHAQSDLASVRRQKIGFVFQQPNLIPALTALDNVAWALRLKGVAQSAAREAAADMLGRVGLGDRLNFLPRELSGGQKQRVAIARALVGRPRVLLADEPTANLDATVGVHVLELFARLAREAGSALLIVTHDTRVRAICDRVVHIEGGVVIEPKKIVAVA